MSVFVFACNKSYLPQTVSFTIHLIWQKQLNASQSLLFSAGRDQILHVDLDYHRVDT